MNTTLDPKVQFLTRRPCAVPAYLVDSSLAPMTVADGQVIQAQELVVDDMVTDAYLLPGDSTFLTDVATHLDDFVFETGTMGDRIVPVVLPAMCKVAMIPSKKKRNDDDEHADNIGRAVSAYEVMLRRLARLTGFDLRFHIGNEGEGHPPYPFRRGVIHIVPGSTPPGGESGTDWRYKAFGLFIREGGAWAQGLHPARGRGCVLKDENGVALIQLLKNTAYVLCPTLTSYHGFESRTIFQRLLALLSRGLRERAQGKLKGKRTLGVKAYTRVMQKETKRGPQAWKDREEEIRKEIAGLERKLAAAYRARLEIGVAAATMGHTDFFRNMQARFPQDYARLSGHPKVERVYVYQGGIHVRTRELVGEHEDQRYRFGTFIVRFETHGRIYVWCRKPLHPKKIPHPHMPRSGQPCYGSAKSALMQAVGELRFADAFDIFVRWLEDGYTPSSADARIEDWPLVPQEVAHD